MNTNITNTPLSAREAENKQLLEAYFTDSGLDISSQIDNIEYLRSLVNSCFSCTTKEEISKFFEFLYKALKVKREDRLDIMSAYSNQAMFMDTQSRFWILRVSTFKREKTEGLLLILAPANDEANYMCLFENNGFRLISRERLESSGYTKLD